MDNIMNRINELYGMTGKKTKPYTEMAAQRRISNRNGERNISVHTDTENTDRAGRRAMLLDAKLSSGRKQTGAAADGSALVSEAKKYLGTPYKWGGNSPEEGGMDCSGYMVKVYKDIAGINLPRTTYEQVKQGTEVKKEQLRPGDLVFFGSADNVHHVGMYIGNGQYIHEPKTGDVAKISDLNARSDFYGARRYVK